MQNKNKPQKNKQDANVANAANPANASNSANAMKAGGGDGSASRKAAAELFIEVVDEGQSLDGLLNADKGHKAYLKLNPRDQNLTRAIVGSALRHKGEIDFALNKMMDRPAPKKARHLYAALAVAAAQILYMDVPDRASVNIAINLINGDSRSKRFKGFANAVLRRMSREKDAICEKLEAPERWLDNLPKWLAKKLRQDYGLAKLKDIAKIHRIAPTFDLTLKQSEMANSDHWEKALNAVRLPSGSLRVIEGQMVEKLKGFDEGKWWVQDASAAQPAKLLGGVKGKIVADLCAAPGGKTAQLIDQGANVTAIDLKQSRLKRLHENLSRLNMKAKVIAADILEHEIDEKFDAILLDAPCSSTGTLRRHPDVAYNKTQADIDALAALQLQLWIKATTWLNAGGVLVFSNCSLLKDEGESLYKQMCDKADELGIEPMTIEATEAVGFEDAINRQGCLRILPSYLPNEKDALAGADGFFAARFKKI